MIPLLTPFLLPTPLYAETHYRFKYFFTLLSRREPEIIIDAPHRIEPNAPLPLLLLAKDAHLYPVTLDSVVATIRQPGTPDRTLPLISGPITLDQQWWWTVKTLDVSDLKGWFECDVVFRVRSQGRVAEYRNDNYRTTSHSPLRVYRAGQPLPMLPGFRAGEMHAHSHYTADQVEFGVPPGACRSLSRAMGHSFFALTDHSYDLDDESVNFLRNDPSLPKWRAYQHEGWSLNQDGVMPTMIRGEEVTVRNSSGRNIHCLVFGDETFHPGSGDSAEQWLRTRSELSVSELAGRLSPNAVMVGAHINEEVPLLQRLLLGRGEWERDDLSVDRLDGVQFWNGSRDGAFARGKQAWIDSLLRGRRLIAIAGNDAHGNFNRFRQIRIPFVKLWEADRQLFGRVFTSVHAEDDREESILRSLRKGHAVMSDGPMACLTDTSGAPLFGDGFEAAGSIIVRAVSSPDFGTIRRISVYHGAIGDSEHVVFDASPDGFTFNASLPQRHDEHGYLRVEVETSRSPLNEEGHLAMTNPYWTTS